MADIKLVDTTQPLLPIGGNERIQALDVVRGFALIGIFLMNIEFFNRPLADINAGLPVNVTGIDAWAGWLIYNFVQGKFWTMFSLLFGMGFAVMLGRAERAGRSFLRPYLRRIVALAVFGMLHHIFIWGGDILFSYAVGAIALLILLYGRPLPILIGIAALLGGGFIPGADSLFGVCASLVVIACGAFYLRSEETSVIAQQEMPLFSAIVLALAGLLAVAALVCWLVPGLPKEPAVPLALVALILLALALLSAKFHEPRDKRMGRTGVGMYLLPFVVMTAFGAAKYFEPSLMPGAATAKPAVVEVAGKSATAAQRKSAAEVAETEADAKAKDLADRAKREQEQKEKVSGEKRVLTQGSYVDAVRMRARDFAENASGEAVFASIVVGMFLLGAWFVRSGVMADTGAHLPLFRKLAWFGLPFGCALGLIGSAIATAHYPGQPPGQYQLASGLSVLGNLPASLGYVGMIVLMLHSGSFLAGIRVLAPAGRMALTNYLTQSVVASLFFYGYGFGHWGLGRAWQVVFVAGVFALQVVFSHAWLSKFHYGPMEWLWRAITYWQLPPMRRTATSN
ncbi:MAG TPA: DUF418 domain-containing protein [Arenimonas sp.]|uniref:DUF418 domain-containing protein n=1 Tax=Arenimonas sp. TaxID=1872635 RepID=UPI002CDB347B|nr:DUF418 domain-containing protein [Arenimonas sp.]HMB55661.1 DUF418 domain-containing protein [Arenimonas sp.]